MQTSLIHRFEQFIPKDIILKLCSPESNFSYPLWYQLQLVTVLALYFPLKDCNVTSRASETITSMIFSLNEMQ
jgi:hypothetical protein